MAFDPDRPAVDAIIKRETDGQPLGSAVAFPLLANLVDPVSGYQNTVVQTGVGEYRIQMQGLVESTIVTNPGDQIQSFLRNSLSSRDLNVNGSITPVVFYYNAYPLGSDPVIRLSELRLVIVTDAMSFDNTFGKTGGVLTNGCLVDGVFNGGSYSELAILRENTSFLQLVGATPFFDTATGKAVLQATYEFHGALTLQPGTADQIRITVRDNIAPGPPYAVVQFRAKVFGVEELP